MQLVPGTVIAFEGLDKTGKSTQVQALRELNWIGVGPTAIHMPSGTSPITRQLYASLEGGGLRSPIGRQLFHLAAHADNVPHIAAEAVGGVLLDRWWWSTVAYGWYGDDLASSGLSRTSFDDLLESIWNQVTAQLVFLFLQTHAEDSHNRDSVRAAYEQLARDHSDSTVLVPRGGRAEVTRFLLQTLRERSLIT